MKILIVNTLLFNHGGPSIYTFALQEMLRNAGHEVELFGMKHPANGKFKYEKFFPSHIDFPALLAEGKVKNAFKVLARMIYSKEARKGFESVLDEFKPDIVHLQNYLHHLTPSILFPARKRGIPIIWTLHDSILACPNTNLFDDNLGKPCTQCNTQLKRYFLPIIKKCKKKSLSASFAASIEAFSFSILRLRKLVDFFVVPSKFLQNQLSALGINTEYFRHIPNFVESRDVSNVDGDFYVYLGRLVREKGILDLIKAAEKTPNCKLEIIGDGPLRQEIEQMISNRNLLNVKLLGYKRGNDLEEKLKTARFIVLPSICYENAPISLLEAMRYGKPAIGSKIGGIPEMIVDNETGLLFQPGDWQQLAQHIEHLYSNENHRKQMGKNASLLVNSIHTLEKHIEEIVSLYNEREKK